MTKYAAFDDQAIWGTGNDANQALNDVIQYISDEDAEKFIPTLGTAVMTEALEKIVATSGGNTDFHLLSDGRLGTWGEWEVE